MVCTSGLSHMALAINLMLHLHPCLQKEEGSKSEVVTLSMVLYHLRHHGHVFWAVLVGHALIAHV